MTTPAELILIGGIVVPLIGMWAWAVADLARSIDRNSSRAMRTRLTVALAFILLTGPVTGPIYLFLRATAGFRGVGAGRKA